MGKVFNKVLKKDKKINKANKYNNNLTYVSVHNFNKYSVYNCNEISSIDCKFDIQRLFKIEKNQKQE